MINGKKYNKVDLYDDSILIKQLDSEIVSKSEMSSFERSFLCGLIREHRPKRILEVGAAAGATTAMVLKCLDNENMKDTVMYSVDYNEQYYLDASKKSGYLVDEDAYDVKWKLYTGHTVAYFLDEIKENAGEIDFLILDTMHILPGEVLDFIVCLPYLSDGCVVVLHDVSLNLLNDNSYSAKATRLLFSSVTGDKYYMNDSDRSSSIANIAGFIVDHGTRINCCDLFSVLNSTWDYYPEEMDIDEYCNVIYNYYSSEIIDGFKIVLSNQLIPVFEKQIDMHCGSNRMQLIERWKNNNITYIYGAGLWGERYYRFAKVFGLRVDGVIISDNQEFTDRQKSLFDGKCYHLSDIKQSTDINILLAVSRGEIYDHLSKEIKDKGFDLI